MTAPSSSKQPDVPGSSDGMPVKTPAEGRPRPGRPTTPRDASDEASLALPHERDQSTDMTGESPDPQVKQASVDIQNKLQDTDKSPGMNKTYQDLKRR